MGDIIIKGDIIKGDNTHMVDVPEAEEREKR